MVFVQQGAEAVVSALDEAPSFRDPVGERREALEGLPLEITTGTLDTALGLSIRLLALALPGVIAFATTDPTDLADGLIQHVRVPPRFAIGALAHPGASIVQAISEGGDGIAVVLSAARAAGFAAVMVSVATALRKLASR